MISRKNHILALIVTLTFAWCSLAGQELPVPGNMDCPAETLSVHLSAESVFTGELLWFKIYCTSPVFPGTTISNIAFVELVSPENTSVVRKKILLRQGKGEGVFSIPSLPTGLYYFVAYTAWMKNSGEASYFRKAISVINPSQPMKSAGDTLPAPGFCCKTPPVPGAPFVLISADKKNYVRGELVKLGISVTGASGNELPAALSVSVGRKEPALIFSKATAKKSNEYGKQSEGSHLPDHGGILLSGTVSDAAGTPVANSRLILSAPGKGTAVSTALTRDDGSFMFLLKPESGQKDLVVTLADPDLRLSIDDPFANGFRSMPGDLFMRISPEALAFLREKYTHLQLQSRFDLHQAVASDPLPEQADSSVFYRMPFRTIHTGRFIQLDSLAEYFYELIPEVRFTKRKSGFDIQVINQEKQIYLEEAPGVFVDGVLYSNYSAIAAIPVQQLDRISVLSDSYYYCDLHFGGIVDIHTVKADFSSVSLTGNMMRFIYPLADRCEWKFKPLTRKALPVSGRIPDFRYLLAWEPELARLEGQSETVTFYTCDLAGTYVVHVQGLTDTGILVSGDYEFTVGTVPE